MGIQVATQFLLAVLVVSVLLTCAYIRRRSSFLRNLQGPASSSFILGNEREIRYQVEVGDCEFKWARQYGAVWRQSGCLGRDRLVVADPKALRHIFHTSGYNFGRPKDALKMTELIFGKGISWAQGEAHQRQRKIMNPAFFTSQLRTFIPLFQSSAYKAKTLILYNGNQADLTLVQKWKEELIAADPSGQPLVNVMGWLSRTTLDIIGEAGFGFQFGSLDNVKTELHEQYENLFVGSTLYPAWYDIVFKSIWCYIPDPLLNFVRYLPTREYRRFLRFSKFVHKFSRDMVEESTAKGDGNDIMSVLLRANTSEVPKSKLTDSEVIAQINTLLFAGHSPTALSLIWYLWEIAKHPEAQDRVRAEIATTHAERGGRELSTADLDSMTFTQATLKESMRLHPITWQLRREAKRDDVIPLAFPVTTKLGPKLSSIPITKGTQIDIAVDVYNRLPEVWGPDADQWNPERFLNLKKTSLGVYSNLMTFGGGVRSCIGWQFAVIEMQIFAVVLLENFEFSLPPQNENTRIYRKPSGLMTPMAKRSPGGWMGLVIKSVD
ncbi:cytochrome P450 [Russula brevipes]|nr:cytochrome P450 [Russula brevipes]